jgi:AraC-like DNA-binding protein
MNIASTTGTVALQEWTGSAATAKTHTKQTRLVKHFAEHATRNWTPRVPPVDEAQKIVAERTRAFIDGNFRESLRMEDLCRATGVGIRTVQRCFKACFGVTTTRYLRAVRLDAAYRDLIEARSSQDSVTRIALCNGCHHLGRFSSEFRKRFGQLPSAVLKTDPLLLSQYRGGPRQAFPDPQTYLLKRYQDGRNVAGR